MHDAVQIGPLPEEDRARADCYALISRLFYAPPDTDLLNRLAAVDIDPAAEEANPGLQLERIDEDPKPNSYPQACEALRQACRSVDREALRQEYDDLFVGAGKALVTPYTSGYAVPHAPDRHLLALREHLAAWGLVRRDSVFEVEDHVSAVCEVMRWLIEHDRPLDEQLDFFNDFVYTGVGTFCNAIEARATTSFYRAVAELARAFLAVERQAFELHTPE